MFRLRTAVFLFAITLASTIATRRATACSCVMAVDEPTYPRLANGTPMPSSKEFGNRSLIFLGTATRVGAKPVPSPTRSAIPHDYAIEFRLEQVWEGAYPFDTITIYTSYIGGGCGFPFVEGRCYLVFADIGIDGRLYTSICERTTEWERSGELMFFLYSYLGTPRFSGNDLFHPAE
jgi:hypothetical protein